MTNKDPKGAIDFYFQNLAWLHLEWELFRALFGSSPERIKALNLRTGLVFRVLQDRLYDHIVLTVARLLDPASVAGRRNLSLAGLIEELSLDESQCGSVYEQLSGLRSRMSRLRRLRNKRIAHLDRDVAIGHVRLEEASRKELAALMGEVDRVHNAIRLAHDGSEVRFIGLDTDAEDEVHTLMKVLDRGNAQLNEEARERRRRWIAKYGADGIDEEFDPGEDAPDL